MKQKATPKSYRSNKTITRSISFDQDVFSEMEERREALRMTRSDYLRALLEDRLGILAHPELGMEVVKKSSKG